MRLHHLSTAILAAALAVGARTAECKPRPPFKVALAEAGFVPFSFPEKANKPGIFMQILTEIGKLTGDGFEAVYAPNKRVKTMFERGEIDIEPGINPAWRAEQAAISIYSEPFTDLTERLMFNDATGAFSVADLAAGKFKKQATLGTVRGYFYPKLEAVFKSGHVKRADGSSEEELVKMLQRRRLDAIVVAEIPGQYHVKQFAKPHIVLGEETDRTPIMFRIHKAHVGLQARINRALGTLKKNGRIDAILAASLDQGAR